MEDSILLGFDENFGSVIASSDVVIVVVVEGVVVVVVIVEGVVVVVVNAGCSELLTNDW